MGSEPGGRCSLRTIPAEQFHTFHPDTEDDVCKPPKTGSPGWRGRPPLQGQNLGALRPEHWAPENNCNWEGGKEAQGGR